MTINSPVAPVPTAPIARTKTREFVMKSQNAMIDTYSWECCANCDHWTEDVVVQVDDPTKYSGRRDEHLGPQCTKYGVRPPTKVILIGCEEYNPSIPF
jgi:hypothetical protein